MNTDSITRTGEEILAQTEVPSLGRLFSLPGLLFAQLQIAHRVEHQAIRLYAMSDTALASKGYSRDAIRERLLEHYND